MNWNFVSLDEAPLEILDGDRGKNYPNQNDFSDQGYCLFLSATNVTKNGFRFRSCQFITEQKDDLLRKGKLKRNDIVVTTRGTIGNVVHYNESVPFDNVRINSGMVVIRTDEEKLYAPFLYAYLRSSSFLKQVHQLRSGVAQPQLPIRDMKLIKIPLPGLDEQKRVAGYVEKYDSLIENNSRRIHLLEESTRLLYKEWFVRLRFPGHEHVKVTDGVPAGWEKLSIKDCCRKISYGYTASSSKEAVGPKLLRITDIVPSSINWGRIPYCAIEDKYIDKYKLHEGDIVVARTGATVGYAKRITSHKGDVIYASYLVRFIADLEVIDDVILGIFMESDEFKSFVKAHAGGAAQPNANAQILGSAKLLVPPKNIQTIFREYIYDILEQKRMLENKSSILAEARDILLPRLMNGDLVI